MVRTNQGGRIDVCAGYAPDGLVGPQHEKEASWFMVRDVWSPVQVDAPRLDVRFDGRLRVHNQYGFSPLSTLSLRWEWLRFAAPDAAGVPGTEPTVLAQGTLAGPAVVAQTAGELKLPLPPSWRQADALRLTAAKGDETVLSWVWPTPARPAPPTARREGELAVRRADGAIELTAGPVSARFDAATGLLLSLSRAGQPLPLGLTNGPCLVLARPVGDGQTYSFPPQPVKALRLSGLEGVRQRPTVKSVQLSFEPARFALPERGAVLLQTGSTGSQAWLDAQCRRPGQRPLDAGRRRPSSRVPTSASCTPSRPWAPSSSPPS